MATKTVRIQLNGSSETVPGKVLDEERGEFKERQRRRSNASGTAGAIKSILKARRASTSDGASSHDERRSSVGKVKLQEGQVNGERRASSHSVLSSSSYSKCRSALTQRAQQQLLQ